MTRLADLRALLAKATRDPESLTAKQHGPYSDVTIPGADLAALLDVAEAAQRVCDDAHPANEAKTLDDVDSGLIRVLRAKLAKVTGTDGVVE